MAGTKNASYRSSPPCSQVVDDTIQGYVDEAEEERRREEEHTSVLLGTNSFIWYNYVDMRI